jgi:DNA-binding transcriptional MerR regulator
MSELDRIADELAELAINLGLNIEQIKECLDEASTQRGSSYAVEPEYDGVVESKGEEVEEEDVPVSIENVTLTQRDIDTLPRTAGDNVTLLQALKEEEEVMRENPNPFSTNPFNTFGKTAFGRKILSKATESVRQIGKKKGIYIVGRKGKKFLGIRFTKKGNYSKNKKGKPNGKMYTLDGLRKMKNKRVSFKKLPQLINMMDTSAVLKKHKDFKFGFELKKSRCSGFGYTFPVGAGYGRRSALLYGKL